MNFDNPEISYFSNILSRSNTGSVPILLLYSLGFSESLILNELLNKRDAYRNARTKLLETNEGYDAFVEGSFFPCPDIELYASTGYEPQKIKRNLNTLVTEKLIVVKKAIAKVGPYKGQPIRHAKISPQIDELLLDLADEGAANIKKSCPELLSSYLPLDKAKLNYLLNNWNLVVNRYLCHIMSTQGSAVYNYIVTEGIQHRSEEYGSFKVEHSKIQATLKMSRKTLDKHLQKLSELRVVKMNAKASIGTVIEPIMTGNLIVNEALLCGEKIHDYLKEEAGSLHKNFEFIKEKISLLQNEFLEKIKTKKSPLQNKLSDAKEILIEKNVPWSGKLEKRYLTVSNTLEAALNQPSVITSEGIVSRQGFAEKLMQMPAGNISFLIAYLTNYDFEIHNVENYITSSVWNDNGLEKHISSEDLDFLKCL